MISVFKTNVETIAQIEGLKSYLDKILVKSHWNFDLEDCDNILRIDSNEEIANTITKILEGNGFFCKELDD